MGSDSLCISMFFNYSFLYRVLQAVLHPSNEKVAFRKTSIAIVLSKSDKLDICFIDWPRHNFPCNYCTTISIFSFFLSEFISSLLMALSSSSDHSIFGFLLNITGMVLHPMCKTNNLYLRCPI